MRTVIKLLTVIVTMLMTAETAPYIIIDCNYVCDPVYNMKESCGRKCPGFIFNATTTSTTTATTTRSTSAPESVSDKRLPVDKLIYIGVGVVIMLAFLCVLFFVCRKKIQKFVNCVQDKRLKHPEQEVGDSMNPIPEQAPEEQRLAETDEPQAQAADNHDESSSLLDDSQALAGPQTLAATSSTNMGSLSSVWSSGFHSVPAEEH